MKKIRIKVRIESDLFIAMCSNNEKPVGFFCHSLFSLICKIQLFCKRLLLGFFHGTSDKKIRNKLKFKILLICK
jgi:hypothetical protein